MLLKMTKLGIVQRHPQPAETTLGDQLSSVLYTGRVVYVTIYDKTLVILLTSFLGHINFDGAVEQLAGGLHLRVVSVHAVLFLAADVVVKRLRHKLRIVVSLLRSRSECCDRCNLKMQSS